MNNPSLRFLVPLFLIGCVDMPTAVVAPADHAQMSADPTGSPANSEELLLTWDFGSISSGTSGAYHAPTGAVFFAHYGLQSWDQNVPFPAGFATTGPMIGGDQVFPVGAAATIEFTRLNASSFEQFAAALTNGSDEQLSMYVMLLEEDLTYGGSGGGQVPFETRMTGRKRDLKGNYISRITFQITQLDFSSAELSPGFYQVSKTVRGIWSFYGCKLAGKQPLRC